MACYQHNIPNSEAVSSSEPLYMVLQNCGRDDLSTFMGRHVAEGMWSAELVRRIYEQLLQGLDYLSPKYVHHDLKPENIIIKVTKTSTYKDGNNELPLIASRNDELKAFLIDFGASFAVSGADQCKRTASTLGFA